MIELTAMAAFLFGHGNRQITWRVIEKIRFKNILVVASPFIVKSGNPMLLSFTAAAKVRSWEIVAMTSNYNAAIAVITLT